MRRILTVGPLLCLIACAADPSPVQQPETSLPFFGAGYPVDGDPCRRLGESPETINYLDDAADLVGCPADMKDLDAFVMQTGAREVFQQDGYIAFSIPTR